MKLNCGIIGLPNVGKSTIFSALSSVAAEASNYAFCTIEPNVGIVNVPDKRLYNIANIFKSKKVIPAFIEFVDIAGLVKGASQGEGLGNQFLGNIRSTSILIHVIRCFDDDEIIHVHGEINPKEDVQIIETELALADLATVEKKILNLNKQLKSQNKDTLKSSKILLELLERLQETLNEGKSLRNIIKDEKEISLVSDLNLLTLKKQIYCCNVDEEGMQDDKNNYVIQVEEIAKENGSIALKLCGKLEKEIAMLDLEEEKIEFLKDLGLEESGLDKLIRKSYKTLDLETFFTAGEKETRAWTFLKNTNAPDAAGIIHTDFKRGFIKAEVYHYEDLMEYGSEAQIKEKGKYRLEGKSYIVKDGDIIFFKFNV